MPQSINFFHDENHIRLCDVIAIHGNKSERVYKFANGLIANEHGPLHYHSFLNFGSNLQRKSTVNFMS